MHFYISRYYFAGTKLKWKSCAAKLRDILRQTQAASSVRRKQSNEHAALSLLFIIF